MNLPSCAKPDNYKMVELFEASVLVPHIPPTYNTNLINHISHNIGKIQNQKNPDRKTGHEIRFVITDIDEKGYHCEIGVLTDPIVRNMGGDDSGANTYWSLRGSDFRLGHIFTSYVRRYEDTSSFNVVLIIPTGIGCELGGHAGDGGAVARLIAQSCDTLVTHPNVVNASDIQELPENGLYVEGSTLTRFMMGQISLDRVRSNRVLVIIDKHEDNYFHEAAINAVNGARASMGLNCSEIVVMENPIDISATISDSGRAVGSVKYLERLIDVLEERKGTYDAVALSTVIKLPEHNQKSYFRGDNNINPWGGAEAMLTHAISTAYDIPSAHSPMMTSRDVLNTDWCVIDPRKSAEVVSITYLHCILRGLHNAPRIRCQLSKGKGFDVRNVSCLIIPDGCVGLPTLAAIEQGIPVIAVKNRNIMKNDLTKLPFKDGKLIQVDNYLEAVGVMNALKGGIALDTIKRPLSYANINFSKGEVK